MLLFIIFIFKFSKSNKSRICPFYLLSLISTNNLFKMKHFSTLLILILFLNSCKEKTDLCSETQSKIDSLETVSNELNEELKLLKRKMPNVIVQRAEGENCVIDLYTLFGLKILLRHKRPDIEPENFLCVPAAYTTIQKNKIDGLFVEDGVKIIDNINDSLTGACIISNDNIRIISLKDLNNALISEVIKAKKSIFQQILLIKKHHKVKVPLFVKSKDHNYIRRALIQFDDFYCIGQSHRPIKISEFQESLISIGALNAINLDMGTYSEGWYKDTYCKKIIIGEQMINTDKQTNWLIYTKQL